MGTDIVITIPTELGLNTSLPISLDKVTDFKFGPYNEDIVDALIIGYGTVGKAMNIILYDAGFMPEILDLNKACYHTTMRETYEVLHICFPCYDEEVFIEACADYIAEYRPKYVLIHSTIGIFTAERIVKLLEQNPVKIFHIPIRGIELDGAKGIKKFISFVGPAKGTIHFADQSLDRYLDRLGMKHEWLRSARESALNKLIGTTFYGMLIAFSNLIAKITDKHDIDFHGSYIRSMETDLIGERYWNFEGKIMALDFIKRPVNKPGKIGGHCVMPNLNLLPKDAYDLKIWIQKMSYYMEKEEENVRKKNKNL